MKIKNRYSAWFFLALSTLILSACSYGDPRTFDTPTQGTESIEVDNSYPLIFDSQIYTFMAQYNDAVINVDYKPESDIFKDLLNDSCDLIVASRDLTKEEKDFFAQKNRFPKAIQIAEEGIALIINRNNIDSVFTMQQLDGIFTGRTSHWKDVNATNQLNDLVVVIDNENSANARFLKENYIKSSAFPKSITTATSNMEVISYVEKNPGAIGLISSAWISNEQDSVCQNYLGRIKLAAIKKTDSSAAYLPYQGYICAEPIIEMNTTHDNFMLPDYPTVVYAHDYPLTRKIFMINAEGGNGLSTGFVAFVSGEKGQLIILKSGIVPAIVPSRSVKVNPESN